MKWIKKQDNCEPWENPAENGPELPKASKWPRRFTGIILGAMFLLAVMTVYGTATGQIKWSLPKEPQTGTAIEEPAVSSAPEEVKPDGAESNSESSFPGEDLTFKGIGLDPAFLGNAPIGGGGGLEMYDFTLTDVLEAKAVTPTLERLQKDRVPYVYDEDGREIALFEVIGVITEKAVDFESLRLTDACVASCRQLEEVELPETVYLDKEKTGKLVMFNDSLYLITKDGAENVSANSYEWQIFGTDSTTVFTDEGIIERMNGQNFGEPDGGVTYRPGKKPEFPLH